jgi:hypothetical protein
MRWNSCFSPISLIVLIHDTSAAPSLPPPEGGATGSGALAVGRIVRWSLKVWKSRGKMERGFLQREELRFNGAMSFSSSRNGGGWSSNCNVIL